MLKISALEWTDLNPKATPFIPRNFDNNDNKHMNESVDFTKTEVNSSANGLVSKSSTSKMNDKSKTKKKSKPTKVTLEQFISEKLKIDDEIKPKKLTINSTHNLKNKNKTQTHEMPNNLLDSSAPTRKRGKERENPKLKKPTTLKKIIIQEKSSSLEKSNNESIDIKTENDSQIENSDTNDSKVVVNYDLNEINRKILHNKTYREYCNQKLSKEIDNFVVDLLSDLVVFQDRLYLRDPIKANMKKRLSFGFREVTKYAIINKVKMLIIAPDIEKIETKGGLDDTLTQLLKVIHNNETPVVFALTRRNLGITCKKRGFISCVGVLNYDGSQDNFKQLITLCESARMEYNSVLDESYVKLKSLNEEEIADILSKLPNIPNEFSDFKRRLNPNDRRLMKRKTKPINS